MLFMFPSAMTLLLVSIYRISRFSALAYFIGVRSATIFRFLFPSPGREIPCHFPCSTQGVVSVYFICGEWCYFFLVIVSLFLSKMGSDYFLGVLLLAILFHVLKWEI